jgi:hypothetical protein
MKVAKEAAPMANGDGVGDSPLDDALNSVEREELGGDSGVTSPDESDPFASSTMETESPAPKPRGRPRNPNGRAAQRAARAAARNGGAPPVASGKVSDPPVPEITTEFEKIAPGAVAESLKQIDAHIVKHFGTVPLTNEEAQAGGTVLGPVLDHYMPMLAAKGGMWVPAFTWVVMVYGPRAYEVLDNRQRRIEAQKRGVTTGAQSGETDNANFRLENTAPVRPFSAGSN